jgi:hypothetical protein
MRAHRQRAGGKGLQLYSPYESYTELHKYLSSNTKSSASTAVSAEEWQKIDQSPSQSVMSIITRSITNNQSCAPHRVPVRAAEAGAVCIHGVAGNRRGRHLRVAASHSRIQT